MGGDNAAFKKHIKDKTGLDVDVEKIFSDLKAKNTVKDPVGKGGVINIDDINNVHDEFFESAKQKIGELLKTLVKKSVDLFIHTTESKHGESYKSVIDVVSKKEDESVDEILSGIDNVSGVIRRVDQYWEKKARQPDEESVSEFEEANESFLEE